MKTKEFLIYISLFASSASARAQQTGATLKDLGSTSERKQSEKTIRTVNDLKTGNWQDVLASFFQLAFTDLSGDKRAISFKANLFALKAKADSNLLLSDRYVKQKFSRNFQFDFSLKLDTDYKFSGFGTGFTWALINKRDSAVISYAGTELDKYFSDAQGALLRAFNAYRQSLLDSDGKLSDENAAKIRSVREAANKALTDRYFVKKEEYPEEIQPFLNDSYISNFEKADSLFRLQMEKVRRQPLLTLSANSVFQNKARAFNNGSAQLVYLQGFKTIRTRTEIDVRSSISIRDTVVVTTSRRTSWQSSAGINFTLLESQRAKSIIEFKPYFEYNRILSKLYPDEKQDLFLANADLRLRILENFWLPLTIKYDIGNGKFLGFLDVEINFSAFRKQK